MTTLARDVFGDSSCFAVATSASLVGARPQLPPCHGCPCRLVLFTKCSPDHQLYQLARRPFNMSTAAAGETRSADVFGHSFLYFYSSQRHGIGLRPMTLARPPIRSQIDGVFSIRGCAAGGPGIRTDLVFRRDSGEKAWAPSTRSITDFKSSWPPFRRGPFLECLPVVSSL